MAYLNAPDGTPYFINDFNDMATMLYEQMGEEVYQLFCQYANECSREYFKAHSDLDSYEASLESNTRAFSDISDEVNAMQKYLDESQRINRQELQKTCDRIQTIISNQI